MARAQSSLLACLSLLTLLVLLQAPLAARAQQAQPALSRSPDAGAGVALDDEATQGQAVARRATVGEHAMLMAYEQCGGEMGLCNRTTIAAPCGDHPWGLQCPSGYDCQRKTAAIWQCSPVVGKKDSADEGPTRFTTAPKGSEADVNANGPPVLVVPVSATPAAGSAATVNIGNGLPPQPANSSEEVTPAVKGCPAGQFSVGNRCFKSAGGSSRRAVTGTLAGSVALLAAWQLAVVLLTALLAC